MNNKKNNNGVILVSLVIIIILILAPMYIFNLGFFKEKNLNTTKEEKQSKIHFLSTGASDCFLIESNGHFGLIDSSNPPFNDGTSRAVVENPKYTVSHVVEYLDRIGVNKLDFIIATHSHSDHIGGMRTIAHKYVDNNTKYYYRTYVETYDTTVYPDWDDMGYYTRATEAMKEKGAELIEVTNQEPSFELGEFNIKLLNTEPASDSEKNEQGIARGENKNSIVTLVTFDSKKVLLTADLEIEDEDKIAEKVGKIDILKMGHHGYATSSKISFLNTLKPKEIIISNENFNPKDKAVAALRYIEKTNGTKAYLTSRAKDAIVATFKNNTYTLSEESGKSIDDVELKLIVEQNGNWERITYNNESVWIYYNNDTPVNGWQQLTRDGVESWYWFDRANIMITGWRELEKDKVKSSYYFDPDGSMARGWRRIEYNNEMKWYYFQFDGRNAKNTCLTIENEKHCFDDKGICYSGKNC
jgi:beta-lactamase superfamily II metal-dependent hydrolase